MLRGAGDLIKVCKNRIAEHAHELSADGDFSWEEVECLGACVNAPMVQIWKDTYEDLTTESFEKVLDGFASGNPTKPGPRTERHLSAPAGALTSLTDEALFNGKGDAQPKEDTKEDAAGDGETIVLSDDDRPEGLEAAREGGPDDLKRISGVGPKIEGILHSLGIYYFDQVAAWTRENVEWVDGYLKFKGRIDREDWIAQAKVLAEESGEG